MLTLYHLQRYRDPTSPTLTSSSTPGSTPLLPTPSTSSTFPPPSPSLPRSTPTPTLEDPALKSLEAWRGDREALTAVAELTRATRLLVLSSVDLTLRLLALRLVERLRDTDSSSWV